MVFFAQVGQPKKTQYRDDSDPAKPIVHPIVVETIEDNQRPIRREITKIYRTENDNLYYSEFLEGEAWNGDVINHSRIVGKFKMPIFRKQRDRANGTVTITGVRDFQDTFEIPFTTGKFTDPSTGKETTLDELPRSKDCVFYVKTPARLFALRGITLDDFKNRPFNDLVHYGEKKSWPAPADVEAPKRRVAKNE